jgi:hypothetical protein
MFTVKFIQSTEQGLLTEAISCMHYSALDRGEGRHTIIIYPKTTMIDGVEYQVSDNSRHYFQCYVENENGKTIARFGPHQPQLSAA